MGIGDVHRATSPSEQAVEVAHSFDNRDNLDLIGVGIMLIEDQVAPVDERAGPDRISSRAVIDRQAQVGCG